MLEYSVDSFNVDGRFIFVTRNFGDSCLNSQLSDLIKRIRPEACEIKIDYVTSGAAESALKAKEYIDNDDPLIIYNSDQYLRWNPIDFLDWVQNTDPRGAVVIYESSDQKIVLPKLGMD